MPGKPIAAASTPAMPTWRAVMTPSGRGLAPCMGLSAKAGGSAGGAVLQVGSDWHTVREAAAHRCGCTRCEH
eukprot:52839-Alexandrium_andersonii.AAC.1